MDRLDWGGRDSLGLSTSIEERVLVPQQEHLSDGPYLTHLSLVPCLRDCV
jgi:hypothetical protein